MVHRQVDRIERVIAHDPQSPVLRPGIDSLEDPVHEVERALGVEDPSSERLEAIRELRHRSTLREGCRYYRCRASSRYVEARELVLTHSQPAGHILDGIRV